MILKRREACLSLIEQAYWISEESPETADRFIDAAAAPFSFLEDNPEIGREYEARNGRLAGVRVWRIPGFEKHFIFYRPYPEGVEGLDVIHGAGDLEALVFGSLREQIQGGLDSGPAEPLDMEAVRTDARNSLPKTK
jgi:toxin ParE1/3/4